MSGVCRLCRQQPMGFASSNPICTPKKEAWGGAGVSSSVLEMQCAAAEGLTKGSSSAWGEAAITTLCCSVQYAMGAALWAETEPGSGRDGKSGLQPAGIPPPCSSPAAAGCHRGAQMRCDSRPPGDGCVVLHHPQPLRAAPGRAPSTRRSEGLCSCVMVAGGGRAVRNASFCTFPPFSTRKLAAIFCSCIKHSE